MDRRNFIKLSSLAGAGSLLPFKNPLLSSLLLSDDFSKLDFGDDFKW